MGFQLKNTMKDSISWINKNGDFSNLLRSRIVLYLFFAISLVNLYSFAINGDVVYGSIFLIVGYLTTFFSKNMIVILCSALVVSNILKYGTEIRVKEGFEEGQTNIRGSEPASGNNSGTGTSGTGTSGTGTSGTGTSGTGTSGTGTSGTGTSGTGTSGTGTSTSNNEKPQGGIANMAFGLPQSSKDDINTIIDAQNKLAQGVKLLQPILDKATAAIERLKK